ncbi:MAG: nucleotide exchange factor GrpE [Pirellulaceae bacterium]|jgi:molecular chaperone GrpE|nr:nucleotide exchange factor GrpE [Pirellulaceae bacterium]
MVDESSPPADGVDPLHDETSDAAEETSAAVNTEEEDSQSAADEPNLADQLHEANGRALRAQAELENFRKRARREIDDERKYAGLPLIRDLLTVMDNLELAIQAAGDSEQAQAVADGVKMVRVQFEGVLHQHGCRRIDSLGAVFDPNLHEAAGQEPTAEYEPGAVCRVLREGYQLHDRVIRPSHVFIATPPAEDSAEPLTAGEEN